MFLLLIFRLNSFDALQTKESVNRYADVLASFLSFVKDPSVFKEDVLSQSQRSLYDLLLESLSDRPMALVQLQTFIFSVFAGSKGLLEGSEYSILTFTSALLVKRTGVPRLQHISEYSQSLAPIVFIGRVAILSQFLLEREYVKPVILVFNCVEQKRMSTL
jgi:hypothetical protein